ncbi:MAG: cell wall hydrolase [Parasphingorhabdus sp.]|nr:cell wall hydrolase [Parasphingorhabdus sp.]
MTNRERLFLALLLTLLIILPSAVPNSGVGRATANSSQSLSQPSERAGENFPGSAFYFTDPNFATPRNYANASENSLTGPADANYTLPGLAPGNSMGVDGPLSANQITPAVFRGSADDNMLQCLTQAVYYEAASEPDAGQRAVAQVVLNRVRHPAYPRTVCGVVYQGSERRTGCQFTFTCDGSLRRTPSAFFWERARRVAADALAGRIGSPALPRQRTAISYY